MNLNIRQIKIFFILLILSYCAQARAQQSLEKTTLTDTTSTYLIRLKDNTSLSGKILERKSGEIIFHDVSIGQVTIAWVQIDKIVRLEENQYCILTTNDGKKFIGLIQDQTNDSVILKTESLGVLTISNTKVREIKLIEKNQIVGGKYRFPNPHATRYFFGPTAIPLEKGEGYFQNAYVLSNSIQFGMTDAFSIGGGMVIPFLVFITPKVGYKVADQVHVGGGLLFAGSTISDLTIGMGVAYGSITLGSKENNFTMNAGWGTLKQENYNSQTGQTRDSWQAAKKPMFSFSAMARLAPKLALVTENWVFAFRDSEYNSFTGLATTTYKYHSVLSVGFRLMGERSSFDFGIAIPKIADEAVGIPYLDYVLKF